MLPEHLELRSWRDRGARDLDHTFHFTQIPALYKISSQVLDTLAALQFQPVPSAQIYLILDKRGWIQILLSHFYSQITVSVPECLWCVRHCSPSFTWIFLLNSMPTGFCYQHSEFRNEDRGVSDQFIIAWTVNGPSGHSEACSSSSVPGFSPPSRFSSLLSRCYLHTKEV